jgi:hypothetical protein
MWMCFFRDFNNFTSSTLVVEVLQQFCTSYNHKKKNRLNFDKIKSNYINDRASIDFDVENVLEKLG